VPPEGVRPDRTLGHSPGDTWDLREEEHRRWGLLAGGRRSGGRRSGGRRSGAALERLARILGEDLLDAQHLAAAAPGGAFLLVSQRSSAIIAWYSSGESSS